VCLEGNQKLTQTMRFSNALARRSKEGTNRIYIEAIVSTSADGKAIDNTEN
jgi:hypothetical protein